MALPSDFDPDGPARSEGLYGLPFSPEDAQVVVIPVPWEATASGGRGTAGGPDAVRLASHAVDLHDVDYTDFWREGLALDAVPAAIPAAQNRACAAALRVIDGTSPDEPADLALVNAQSAVVNAAVQERAEALFDAGRIPAVLGGDHSSPYGLLAAAAARHPGLGVLHIDAHADLRPAYMGFTHSHASIFHNALALSGIERLVGVGYRDMGQVEFQRVRASTQRIRAFLDLDLATQEAQGTPWSAVVSAIVSELPPIVHVSIDIDGLRPELCPHTGTPVPGGLSFRQLQLLLRQVSAQRRIVSFDLCEVAAQPWDASVGARVLYKLSGAAVRSRGEP